MIRLYISVNSFRISPKIYDEATQTRPPKKSASQSTFYLPAIFVSGFRDSRVIFFGSTIKELDSHFPFWLSRKHSFFRHPHTHTHPYEHRDTGTREDWQWVLLKCLQQARRKRRHWCQRQSQGCCTIFSSFFLFPHFGGHLFPFFLGKDKRWQVGGVAIGGGWSLGPNMFLKFIRRIPKKTKKKKITRKETFSRKRKKRKHFSLNTNASVSPSAFPSAPTNSSGRGNFCFPTAATTRVHCAKIVVHILGIYYVFQLLELCV